MNNGTRTDSTDGYKILAILSIVGIIAMCLWVACSENPVEPVYIDNTTHVELPTAHESEEFSLLYSRGGGKTMFGGAWLNGDPDSVIILIYRGDSLMDSTFQRRDHDQNNHPSFETIDSAVTPLGDTPPTHGGLDRLDTLGDTVSKPMAD